MDNKLYNIDENIFKLDDNRVKALKNGEISQIEFMRMITPEDPFMWEKGTLRYISKQENNKRKNEYIKRRRDQLTYTGGITANIFWENRKIFSKIYPKLKNDIKNVEKEIEKEQCKGCALSKKVFPILQKLFNIKYIGQDLSLLEPILPEYSIKKLQGKKFDVNKIPIKIPLIFKNKKNISVKNGEKLIKNPLGIIRPTCLDCVRKHCAHAIIQLREVIKGYTKEAGYDHEEFALANIDEAIDESLKDNLKLAKKINSIKETYLQDNNIKNLINNLKEIIKITLPKGEYNEKDWIIIGLLSEIEDLLVDKNDKLIKKVRQIRLEIMKQEINK